MSLAGIGSLIGGVAGLFSKQKGAPSARENTVKLAQGARQASERYGFNPLTMLGAGSSMGGGGGGGGAPPLASIQMLTEGLQSVDDVISGDADRRRQADQLQLDLAKVQLEQARSGVIASAPTAADAVGGSLSPWCPSWHLYPECRAGRSGAVFGVFIRRKVQRQIQPRRKPGCAGS